MPFDAATVSQSIADKIGVVSVPMAVLNEHKDKVHREFFADPMHLVRNHLAKWVEYSDRIFNDHRITMLGWAANSLGTVPTDVQTVVGETERRLKAAGVVHEKALGRFDTDPYVVFRWKESDNTTTTICVAVWDKGEVLHIAKLT